MDPRTMSLGTDRWLTDSRVYNLIWLGRWIERAQNVARMLLWAAEHEATNDLRDVLGMPPTCAASPSRRTTRRSRCC